jgi:hypothetical protein
MRVGSSPFSAHQAGMSALWHDLDYIPEKRFETPTVHKGLDDMALPSEQHQLPAGVDDPFKKLDEIYDVAAQQMERGLKGQSFLNGSNSRVNDVAEPSGANVVRHAIVNAQKGGALDNRMVDSVRSDFEQIRATNQAAAVTVPKAKGTTKTAAEGEAAANASQASSVGDALGAAAVFLPMAAGQGVLSVAQGPLPVLATQAITVTAAAAGAATVTATGVAEGLREDEPMVPKRGLKK